MMYTNQNTTTTIKGFSNNMEVRFGFDTEDRRISREILQNNSRLRFQTAAYNEARAGYKSWQARFL